MRRQRPSRTAPLALAMSLLATACAAVSESSLLTDAGGSAGPVDGTAPSPDAGPPVGRDASPPVPADASLPPLVDAATTDAGSFDATTDATTPDDASSSDASSSDAPPDAAPPPAACVPGQSIGCVGPGGCTSNQVCNAAGSAYGPCACANDGGGALACVPGQSIACAGPNGCSSFQVCVSDGSGYGPCDCPGADAGASWTPAQLAGLVLWYDDSYGIVMDPQHPGNVLHWRDKSGHGNDATLSGYYLGTGQWYGSPLDPQVVNGRDAVLCNPQGGSMAIRGTADLTWGTGDFGIVIVEKGFNGGSTSPTNGWSGNGVTLNNAYATYSLAANGETVSVTGGTSWFDTIVARGQTLRLSVNGKAVTGAATVVDLDGGAVTLCSANDEIAEVIVVKGTLDDADVANVTAYLKAKFAL